MNRIIIIGNSGSGKSTLAKELAVRLNLPLIHLDKLFWRDNWQHISRDEFDDLLLSELKKERWIIDGNFGRTIPLRLPARRRSCLPSWSISPVDGTDMMSP